MEKCKFEVGVIVPIYKVDIELVKKCVESIVRQTYKNIKVILVDDGNDATYVEKLEELLLLDERIVLIHHEKNKGLFQARLTGVMNSQTDYIAFVDADDSITIDWIRLLVKNAKENDSDIVMGKTINVDENGRKYVFSSNYSFCNRHSICDGEIFDMLMQDKGLDFSIHTVWNKLYSKRLWDVAWNDLAKVNKHLIMTEDILFSFILFYYAKKMTFSDHEGYFYYRNAQSSTISASDAMKIKKNIDDLSLVFSSVESFLLDKNLMDIYSLPWKEWKSRYFRWWSDTVLKACNKLEEQEKDTILNRFLKIFNKTKIENAIEEDSYFGRKRIGWNDALENIKQEIISEECKVVSFDLFDTLIMRPVLEPDDVYDVVLNDLNIEWSERKKFKSFRKLAEKIARESISKKYPQYEDVTLTEIYNTLCDKFGIEENLCRGLKTCEENVEIEFANKRKLGYELFTLAQESGKKVFVTSDMYLEISIIKKILQKNGYNDCEILLSSKERLLKSSGHLFEKLISKSGVEPTQILHIGDNWESDGVKPISYGIKTFFIPKSKDILLNYLGDVDTGNAAGKAVENVESVVDVSEHFSSFPIRCMYATVANNMFDNPYVSFYAESDYNGDPYYLGNFAVGMHMFGIAKWLSDLVDQSEYHKVHFVARDGYYLQDVYERIRKNKNHNNGISNYLYASRKAFIPLEIENTDDVEKIYLNSNYKTNTPRSVWHRYETVLNELTPELERECMKNGFIMDMPFQNERQWFRFIEYLKKNHYSKDRAYNSFVECQNYLKKNIGKGDLIFDLGYSGNLHSQILKAIGFEVEGAYVNFSGYEAMHKNKSEDLQISTFYDFVPCMYGIITEYIFSDRGPSCVGYAKNQPLFERKMQDDIGDYVVREINRGAYDFADRFLLNWEDRMNMMDFMPIDSGLQFEKFLVTPTKFDQAIFDCCYAEDEFYGGIKKKRIREIWDWQLQDRHVMSKNPVQIVIKEVESKLTQEEMAYQLYLKKIIHKNIFVKALYWLCVDKNFFGKRCKEHLKIETK